jgi:3'(2'), 5'-bisphosphate nucleotidase
MFKSKEVAFALDAVRKASRLVRQVQSEMVTTALTKTDRSPVTVADFAAQALVVSLLAEVFPHDSLVGEEDAAELRDSAHRAVLDRVSEFVGRLVPGASPQAVCDWIDLGGAEPRRRFWTLDPVDGTKGFLRGDQYVVALALIVEGEVQLGILGCPNLVGGCRPEIGGPGSLICAIAGQGTWTAPLGGGDFQRLRVSDRADPAEARVLRSVESGHTNVGAMGELVKALGVRADPVLMDSQAKYGVLAAGEGDLLFRLLSADKPDYREKIWDQAAGSLVVQEAGGRISDLEGKPLDFTQGRTLARNRGVLASNRRLHDAALEVIRSGR